MIIIDDIDLVHLLNVLYEMSRSLTNILSNQCAFYCKILSKIDNKYR